MEYQEKKNSENSHKKSVDIKEEDNENNNDNENMEEQRENENEENNNNNYIYEDINDNNSNNNYDDNIKNIIRNNVLNEDGNINNIQDYYPIDPRQYIDNLQRHKLSQNINIPYYDNQDNLGYNYKANGIGYIINQFVNNLSDNIYEFNPNEIRPKKNKRKNTFESIGEESYFGNDNNYELINNQGNISVTKSRKNSLDSINNINKLIQNDNKDFKELYKKVFGNDEINQNKSPFEMNDFRNQNILDDDNMGMNLLNRK